MKYSVYSFIQSFALTVGLLTAACNIDDSDDSSLIEFGATANDFTVNATAGHIDIEVLSNQNCKLWFLDETPWADLSTNQIKNDGKFYIDYDDNAGFPRMAKVIVEAENTNLRDTITLKQQGGITPTIALPSSSLIVAGSASGTGSIGFDTNVDFAEIGIEVSNTSNDSEQWIHNISYDNGSLEIEFDSNPNLTQLRTATVTMSYVNGWGETQQNTLYVIQKTADDSLGKDVDFSSIRQMAVMDIGTKISDFIIISGYVVSNADSGNVGENPKTTTTTIDYSTSKRTVYIESLDGKYGLCIETATAEDNIFSRYDKVRILLNGATLTGYENPDRYVISDVTASMIVGREAGSAASIPVKEKYIADLDDDDMFTFVTLKDCEFPIRKGSLTPVHEGYTLGDNKNMLSKYPRLVRDAQGSSIYLYTNTTCPYRRSGTKLPYGSGDISGVVVFEYYASYIYGDGFDEDTQGNIGRYQLRHMAYEDIDFDSENSFSQILTEYRYLKDKARDPQDGYTYWYPTLGNNGRFTHSQSTETGKYPGGAYAATTWNYLGPVGTKNGVAPFTNHMGNTHGLGIILEDGTDYLGTNASVNTDGKGQDGANNSWANINWWDDTTNRGESWRIEFSTQGIHTDHLSMQFTAQSGRAVLNCSPIYWKAEWSLTGDLDNDAAWTYIASYQVPDFPVFATYREWQLPAFKQIDIELPLEMLDHEKVYIRLTPERNTANNLVFGASLVNSGEKDSGNAMDYFAIRYNK